MTIFTVQAAVEAADKVPGWMTRAELAWLAEQAGKVPPGGSWLEIGVHTGRSLLCVAMALPTGAFLHGVDCQLWVHGHDAWPFVRTLEQIVQLRPDIKLGLHRKTAAAALQQFADSSLDVVFIDADHSDQGTSREIILYQPKLQAGGLLSGHDYNPTGWPGVVSAVDRLLPEREVGPGSIWSQRG